ncbi:hypothetical protein [Paraprevotella xylaniphila]|nr:hypothetical protein [Paraprevotella xylaniphila]
MEQNAAKIVTSAILDMDFKTVVVAGNAYIIMPPTMKKLAGAGYWLSGIKGDTIKEVFLSKDNIEAFSHALSWLIQGDESLFEELLNGTDKELSDALEEAYSLISAENFSKLLALAKNVANLTAKPKQ